MAARRLICPMRLLDRYLFRELLAPLAYCLGGLVLLGNCFSLFGELSELQDRKLHLLDVLGYCAAITPEFLAMILPITLLLALLYTLTNLSRANELTAMRAAGISLGRICLPYLAVGCALSVAVFFLNEFLVPRSTDWKNHILSRYVQKPGDVESKTEFRNFGFTNARGHRAWFIGEYHLATAEMFRPQVDWYASNGSIQLLRADRAAFTNEAWTFFNVAEFSQADASAPLAPSLTTNVLVMPDFDETPNQIRSEIKISSYQSLKRDRSSDIPLTDIFAYLRLHPNLPPADSGWLFTKFHGRIAAPWTCLVVVLIAIPFGAAPGRRNLFVGVASSIFICFGYFVIQQIGLALGSGGYLPAWLAAWLPNLIFGALGLTLMLRVR
jgi:lipopolysaccharide export system permease protein